MITNDCESISFTHFGINESDNRFTGEATARQPPKMDWVLGTEMNSSEPLSNCTLVQLALGSSRCMAMPGIKWLECEGSFWMMTSVGWPQFLRFCMMLG